ncbi:hypothetical protein Hanom_Chr17g01565101 [Helianthus anomalus]
MFYWNQYEAERRQTSAIAVTMHESIFKTSTKLFNRYLYKLLEG